MNANVTIRQRVRPIRLAFVVNVEDSDTLQKVFEINTCLWGGMYNAIIPATDDPAAIQGYLQVFEPDWLITTNGVLPETVQFPRHRVSTLEDILPEEDGGLIQIGIDTHIFYSGLWNQEFKYTVSGRPQIKRPSPPQGREQELDLFYSAWFGKFLSDSHVKIFDNAFNAHPILDGENKYLQFFNREIWAPLQMGSFRLRLIEGRRSRTDVLLLIDAQQKQDLVNFWNLRACGYDVYPIPLHKKKEIAQAFQGKAGIRGFSMMVIPATSRRSEDVDEFCADVRTNGGWHMQKTPYPRFADFETDETDDDAILSRQWVRHDLADKKNTDYMMAAVGTDLFFSVAHPTFSKEIRIPDESHMPPKYISVVTLSGFTWEQRLAQVFPRDLQNFGELCRTGQRNSEFINSEGIISFLYGLENHQNWRCVGGFDIARHWMKERGFTTQMSSSGRMGFNLLRQLGGIPFDDTFANPQMLKLLNKVAHGDVEHDSGGSMKSATARYIKYNTLRQTLRNIFGKEEDEAERRIKALLDIKALRAGIELQCEHCQQWGWHALETLSERIQCDRCLQDFPFPACKPPSRDSWCYRTSGPFSVENYVQGNYTVVLFLRFLMRFGEVTWSPAIEIRKDGPPREIDFFAWWSMEKLFTHDAPILILGECKTFNRFEESDVERMKLLASDFPGATLVFATLRDKLSDKEKKMIQCLVDSGRKGAEQGQPTLPVIILTERELFDESGILSCLLQYSEWRDNGSIIRKLCNETQKRHLSMSSRDDTSQ